MRRVQAPQALTCGLFCPFDVVQQGGLEIGVGTPFDHHPRPLPWGQAPQVGQALLGDFGAASLMDQTMPHQTEQLQRIESRAFACLLEELLERCEDIEHPVGTALQALQQTCAHENPAGRPLFADIANTLSDLTDQFGPSASSNPKNH